MAAKFFTGLPLDGPDPECVLGHGEALLAQAGRAVRIPAPAADHSRRAPAPARVRRRSPRRPGGHPLMAGEWFESVAEAQRRAERRLPASVAKAIWAGAERGLTLRDNVAGVRRARASPPTSRACRRSATCRPR